MRTGSKVFQPIIYPKHIQLIRERFVGMNHSPNEGNKNKDSILLQIVQWYESNSLD